MAIEDPRWGAFLKYLRKGHTREDAVRLARLSGPTLRNAMARAQSGDEEYIELFESIKRAEAEAVDGYMERLDRAAEGGDVRAIRLGLESLRPERFRPQAGPQPQHQQAHVVTDDAAKQHLIELAVRLISEDPKARQAIVAALEGKDLPQLPEGEILPDEDGTE